MRNYIYLLILLFTLPASAQDIYSWTDDNGERHFSDTPQEGSEEVVLSPMNTFESPEGIAPAATPLATESEEETDEAAPYESFGITSPSQDDVLWNTGGIVDVTMNLSPRLKPGHKVSLLLDGTQVAGRQTRSLTHQLTEVERGMHELKAAIVDARNQVILEAEAVNFMVQQNSVLNPNNPNNNGGPPIAVPLGGGGAF